MAAQKFPQSAAKCGQLADTLLRELPKNTERRRLAARRRLTVNDAGWAILARYSPSSALCCLIIGKRLGPWALVTERRDRAPALSGSI
jgi:hypothetical protein